MFTRPFSRVLTAALAVALLCLSACQFEVPTDEESEPALAGYFKSGFGDGFEISGSAADGYQFTQYDDAAKNVSFAGSIVSESNLEAESGYLTLRITDGGSWGKTVDYYYVIHWQNLSGAGVQAAGASLADWEDPINNGIADRVTAEVTYTVENGYFGYHGEYERQ